MSLSAPTAPASPPAPGEFHKYDHLWNRTFVGLLIAQFLAAFNDQAIHASAMFFAINRKALPEEFAITLMPVLFFAPWAMFPTLAGYFADKYSKRYSLVFWKFAEIGITAVALLGFILGSELNMPNLGSWMVLSTVFLMGTHSTFFVPAKYGAMPEILRAELLSKGNGILESLSFLATILGTVMGGVLSYYFNTDEYIIGLILVTLAIFGSLASLLIRRMPAANPQRKFMGLWGLFDPLIASLGALWKSKPLRFALVGIAFFTFMLAFMRAAVYMLGESRVPRWTEERTSLVVGLTALGIGVGSPLAGWLSGKKVELGLIPIGGVGMILLICMAAVYLMSPPMLMASIVLIGFFTGFYLVPMFTQLQHRAPKDRKGETISSSNFVNVLGAILASGLSLSVISVAHHSRIAPLVAQEDGPRVITIDRLDEDKHHRPVYVLYETEDHVGGHFGIPQDPTAPPAIWLIDDLESAPEQRDVVQIQLTQKAQVAWSKYEDALRESERGQGPAPVPPPMRCSRYSIQGTQQVVIRLAGEDQPKVFDNRELPRYMFFGAAAMTLVVLLLLWWLLPDLPKRSRWLLQSLGRERLRVDGILNVPGHGPVILATDVVTDRDRINVRWGCDRRVHFVGNVGDVGNVQRGIDHLQAERVVAVTMNDPAKVDAFLQEVEKRVTPSPVVLPVHVESAVVAFGAPLAVSTNSAQLLTAIRVAEGHREEE
ncbi:MAG: MFS transporter [Gemmataceae bacterium]